MIEQWSKKVVDGHSHYNYTFTIIQRSITIILDEIIFLPQSRRSLYSRGGTIVGLVCKFTSLLFRSQTNAVVPDFVFGGYWFTICGSLQFKEFGTSIQYVS